MSNHKPPWIHVDRKVCVYIKLYHLSLEFHIGHFSYKTCLCFTVFKTKVLQAHEERRQSERQTLDSGSESSTSSADGAVTQAGSELTTAVNSSFRTREVDVDDDPTRIIKQHEEFLKKQVALVKGYVDRKQQLPSMSSRRPTEEDEEGRSAQKKQAIEGRGPRTTPSSVKNRRKKLKKRRAKGRALVNEPHVEN